MTDTKPPTRRIAVLGSTGSIGRQTLDVIARLNARAAERGEPPMFDVVGLAAGRNASILAHQASAHTVPLVALADPNTDAAGSIGAETLTGPRCAVELVERTKPDLVMAAMVGVAGLPATLAAIRHGADIALANKETLVAAGAIVVPEAERAGVALLPVDSEHAALWQCLLATPDPASAPPHAGPPPGVKKVTLTASGGALRDFAPDDIVNATPAQVLAHPTWNMGPKVTVDCASLTNKALEVIEAHWLFGLPGDMIDVVVHPQSIVHSLVEFEDRSFVAQLGPTDMRCPIQRAITWPDCLPGAADPLDIATLRDLTFRAPDLDRFPALGAAWRVMELGGAAGAVFNAANEAAVEMFLSEDPDVSIPFGRIAEYSLAALDALTPAPLNDLDDLARIDAEAREFVRKAVAAAV